MPRRARAARGGVVYHVINRGNNRAQVFLGDEDYQECIDLLEQGCERYSVEVLAYCLMPNHFHLVVIPGGSDDLGRLMHWLQTTQARRRHKRHGSSGHVWQGRFKAFPVYKGEALLRVIRYVERNALRANLVAKAEDWPWGSLHWWGARANSIPSFLAASPVQKPRNWRWKVNQPETEAELAALRRSVNRGTPFGPPDWIETTAKTLGLEFTLRPRGRPRKQEK